MAYLLYVVQTDHVDVADHAALADHVVVADHVDVTVDGLVAVAEVADHVVVAQNSNYVENLEMKLTIAQKEHKILKNRLYEVEREREVLCRRSSIRTWSGSVPVYLNVYDLTSINGYAYWLGLGVYHSGVQVHGVEYAFGAHDHPTTGIFEGEPRRCDGFTFRKSILIGWTAMTPTEVREAMEKMAQVYKGNAYNLVSKNCNHFCNDACVRLTGNPIPSWVNRLARIGLFCNCLVPVSLSNTKIRHHRIEDKNCEGDENKLRRKSNEKISSSSSCSSSSSSSPNVSSSHRDSRNRSCSVIPSPHSIIDPTRA